MKMCSWRCSCIHSSEMHENGIFLFPLLAFPHWKNLTHVSGNIVSICSELNSFLNIFMSRLIFIMQFFIQKIMMISFPINMNYKWIMKKLKVLLLSLSQIIIKSKYLVFLDTKHNDQLSFGQIPMEISKGIP